MNPPIPLWAHVLSRPIPAAQGLLLALLLTLTFPAHAAAPSTLTQAQESRAVALGEEIRCVVCQAESINDSAAAMARDLRNLIRERLAAGASDAQIRDDLRARYGDFILLRPPVQANTLPLWLLPGALLLLAGGVVFRFVRRHGERSEARLPRHPAPPKSEDSPP